MKILPTTASLAALLFLACGCESTGLSARDPQGQYTTGLITELCTRAATQPSTETHGLPRPAKIAIAQVGEIAPPQSMVAALQKRTDRFSAVTTVPALTAALPDYVAQESQAGSSRYQFQLNAYRGLAAQAGADYLVLVGGTADTLEEATPLSLFDLTIVGLFIMPSRHMSGEVKAVAVAIDTHTGQTVAVQSAQANGGSLVPALQVDSERLKLTERLRDEAAVKIAQQLGS